MTESEFRAAFDAHKDAVYRFAWRMTNSSSAAEDIAQDVFLCLLRQPDRFDGTRGRLRSYLLGIARNLARKKWRDEHRWETLDDGDFVAHPRFLQMLMRHERSGPRFRRWFLCSVRCWCWRSTKACPWKRLPAPLKRTWAQ